MSEKLSERIEKWRVGVILKENVDSIYFKRLTKGKAHVAIRDANDIIRALEAERNKYAAALDEIVKTLQDTTYGWRHRGKLECACGDLFDTQEAFDLHQEMVHGYTEEG